MQFSSKEHLLTVGSLCSSFRWSQCNLRNCVGLKSVKCSVKIWMLSLDIFWKNTGFSPSLVAIKEQYMKFWWQFLIFSLTLLLPVEMTNVFNSRSYQLMLIINSMTNLITDQNYIWLSFTPVCFSADGVCTQPKIVCETGEASLWHRCMWVECLCKLQQLLCSDLSSL